MYNSIGAYTTNTNNTNATLAHQFQHLQQIYTSNTTSGTTPNCCHVYQNIIKGQQPADILYGFFGDDIHALFTFNEYGYVVLIPFIDKFGMVWLQTMHNYWVAYDRDKFFEWVHSNKREFDCSPMTKDDVMKLLHHPDNITHH